MNAIESKQSGHYELKKGLRNLMDRCEDARLGYKNAMELVDENSLKRYFEAKSLERARFRNQIKNDILILGGSSEGADTTIMAGAHRAWMNLRASIAQNDAEAILSECIRGEKELLDAFDYCLENKPMNNDVRHVLSSNKNILENTILQLEDMVAKEALVS